MWFPEDVGLPGPSAASELAVFGAHVSPLRS